MPYYKDKLNNVHYLDDAACENFLPVDCVKIADDEVEKLYAQAPVPTREELDAQCNTLRQAAYIAEADPLFFKSMRGEASRQDWVDKIEGIKARYPRAT